VLAEAIRFNAPIRWTDRIGPSYASSNDANLVLDTVKRAEDSDALVLRLYEPHGARGVSRIRVPGTSARRVNVLEQAGEPLGVDNGDVVVPFRPWEIITVTVA
jgi:alpha-mannosidase